MSKPTLVQSILNRPSQSYSALPSPPSNRKDFYSTRQDMLNMAATAVLESQKRARASTPQPTSHSSSPSKTVSSPTQSVMSGGSSSTTPRKSAPEVAATNSKATFTPTSSKASTPTQPSSTTTPTSRNTQRTPNSGVPQRTPTQSQPITSYQALQTRTRRLSYNDRCDPDSDSEGGSNLDAYFTPPTSPRTSMASSAATITFPSGSTTRKTSRKSLKSAAAADAKAGLPSVPESRPPTTGTSTPATNQRPPPGVVAVPSTRTPSNSSDRQRAMHVLSTASSLSSNSLEAHSALSDWLESTAVATTLQSDNKRDGDKRRAASSSDRGKVASSNSKAVPSNGSPSTTAQRTQRSSETARSTSTTVSQTATVTAPRTKQMEPTSRETRHHSSSSEPDPRTKTRATKTTTSPAVEPTKIKATVTPVSAPQPNAATIPTKKVTHTNGTVRPENGGSAKGKDRENQASVTPVKQQTSPYTNGHTGSTLPSSRTPVVIPPGRHTFSAFAPITTSTPPPSTKAGVPPAKPPQIPPPPTMPVNIPPPPQTHQNAPKPAPVPVPPPRKKSASKPPSNFVMYNNMGALLEEDEEAPFTPRMDHRDVNWPNGTNGSDSSPGRQRTLRHTSGSKPSAEQLRRRRSRSLESLSSHSGSISVNTSKTGTSRQPQTLTSEVQALSLATLGEIPSKGTQGYSSLVLPRAPPPTSFAAGGKGNFLNEGWGKLFSSVGDGKVDLTRSGLAQTTMATVEVVRGLGATAARRGSLSGVLNVFAGGRKRSSSGPSVPISLPSSGARPGEGGGLPAGNGVPQQPRPIGAEGTVLGFTSHRKPPNFVPSGSVLVQVWAVGVDEVDGRLVGVRFGTGDRVEVGNENGNGSANGNGYGDSTPNGILGGHRVDEPEDIQTADEAQQGESEDDDEVYHSTPGSSGLKKGLVGLGRSLSIKAKMASLSRGGSKKGKEDLSRSASASVSQKQASLQISGPQPHKRSTSFSLKRNNTTSSNVSGKTADGEGLKRGMSVSSTTSTKKAKHSYAEVGYIPGRSFVGRVLECGWEVKDEVVKKGEWVIGLLDVRKCGALAEFIIVDRHRLRRVPNPRPAAPTDSSSKVPTPLWTTAPISTNGSSHPPTLTLEELALLPLCGLPAYRAVRTFLVSFSGGRDGHTTPNALEFSPSAADIDAGRGRVLVLRGHDGAGAMAVQMLVQKGWKVSVHVPLSALPVDATYDQEEAYKQSAEDRARVWGADEVIFDDGEVGGLGDYDGRGAAVRVLDSLTEEGDLFDAILDTIGGKEVREAAERLLRNAPPPPPSSPLPTSTIFAEATASPNKYPKKGKTYHCGQFTTLIGDVPERAIPSAGDNLRAGLRALRFGSADSAAGLNPSPRKGSDEEAKPLGKIGYAWISVAHDVDWEGDDVAETLGTIIRMTLEHGIRPWVGEMDGQAVGRPRVVPFEKAPLAFVDGGPLGEGGTVVVRIAA